MDTCFSCMGFTSNNAFSYFMGKSHGHNILILSKTIPFIEVTTFIICHFFDLKYLSDNPDVIMTFGIKPTEKQEGHDGPVSLHWLIHEIHSYQTLHYLGIGLKHKTPYKD